MMPIMLKYVVINPTRKHEYTNTRAKYTSRLHVSCDSAKYDVKKIMTVIDCQYHHDAKYVKVCCHQPNSET
jgi:hypothetical protein